MGSVAAAAVEAVRATEGLEAAQALVDRVARLPSPGGNFWRAAVQLESAAAAVAEGVVPGRSSATVQVSPRAAQCGSCGLTHAAVFVRSADFNRLASC